MTSEKHSRTCGGTLKTFDDQQVCEDCGYDTFEPHSWNKDYGPEPEDEV